MTDYTESKEIHEKCVGCERIFEAEGTNKCEAYADPSYWWDEKRKIKKIKTEDGDVPVVNFYCPLATHYTPEASAKTKGKINPIKASKRKA